jgi:streptogramin lyase
VAEVKVPQGPCQASDTGYGAFWTATCTTEGLARINPETNKVSGHLRLNLPDGGSESSIGVGEGSVWVIVDDKDCVACRLARVDARRLRVQAMVPISPNASAVRFGAGHVWVTHYNDDLLEKIDPQSERVVAKVQVGSGPRFFAIGEGAVWTLNQRSGSVTRVEIASGNAREIETPFAGEGGDMTVGGGWVWVRGGTKLLGRLDPRTNQLVETYGPDSGSGAVAVGYDAAWISAHDVDTVWRLPLESV